MIRSVKLYFTLALMLAVSGVLNAAPAESGTDYSLTVLRSGFSGFTVVFELNDYRLEEAPGGCQRLRSAGFGENLNPGQPDLPALSKAFALPGDLEASVRVIDLQREFIESVKVVPVLGKSGAAPEPNPDFYAADAAFPAEYASLSRPVIAGGQRLAALNLYPFRFHPAQNRLETVRRLELEITFSPGGDNPKIRRQTGFTSPAVELMNPEILTGGRDDLERGAYLFILPDSLYYSDIRRLVDWKRAQGFPATVSSMREIGATAAELKQFLSDAYYNWETPPEYVLLAGDVDGALAIPSFDYECWPGEIVPSDHEYTLLEGQDYFPDLHIGRLPARSRDELAAVVRKILLYEVKPQLAGTAWLDRALLIADTSALQSRSLMDWAREMMADYGCAEIDTVYYFSSIPVPQTMQFIDRGVGIIAFRGWADWGGLTPNNIYGLNNGTMTPLVLGCGPAANSFSGAECHGEAWLRAGTFGSKGAVGCIGPSSENTWSRYEATICQGMLWGLYREGVERAAAMLDRGKMEAWLAFPFNRGTGTVLNSVEAYFHVYNLLGDPGMSVRTMPPEAIAARSQRSIPLGQNGLEIIASAGGAPLEGACASIYKAGEIVAARLTNPAGRTIFETQQTAPGEILLAVNKRDYIPHIARIPVGADQRQLTCASVLIDDDSLGASQGNSNGQLNPGETVELTVSLMNTGPVIINGVAATISSDNPLVNILENRQTFGNIPTNSIAINIQPYVISLDPVSPDSAFLEIRMIASDSQGRWYYSLCPLSPYAPGLEIVSLELPGIAPDTLLTPGCSTDIVIQLRNIGRNAWEQVYCLAQSSDTGLVFTDSVCVFPSCPPDSVVSSLLNPLRMSAHEMLFYGSVIPVKILFQTDGVRIDTFETTFNVNPPSPFDPVVASDGFGYLCFDDGDVAYDNSPIFQWREINPNQGGGGTVLELTDDQPNRGDSRVIDLPAGFLMRHYGQEINQITICSNGWLACGATSSREFRNKPIPSAGTPRGVIAPFWDDLMLTRNAVVCYYHDQTDSAFIVEWYQTENAANSETETFEAVIWDAAAHPTPSGDSPISFLYDEVEDVDYFFNWSSVGISNPEGDAGLQYLFSSLYTPGADTLEDNTALYFTTDPGARVRPPALSYRPNSFTFNLQPGQTDSDSIFIINQGEADLNYNFSVELWLPEGSGGPDSYGYIWVDSDENIGRPFNWVDITQTGTQIIFPHNDSTSAPINLGFDFNFYGLTFNSIIVSANGWCSFTSHSNAYNNRALPSYMAPENLISPFWDDLDPLRGNCQVYHWVNNGDSAIISFHNIERWNTSNSRFTFQLILERAGNFTLQYLSMTGTRNSATIGIQNQSRNIGLTIAHNENYVHDSLRIDILKPWLSLDPMSGTVVGGDTDIVAVAADAGGFAPGNYRSDIILNTNDPNNQVVEIPASLTVTSPEDVVGLTISLTEGGAKLSWKGTLGYIYNIYRSPAPGFNAENTVYIGRTEECEFIDDAPPAGGIHFYRVIPERILW